MILHDYNNIDIIIGLYYILLYIIIYYYILL